MNAAQNSAAQITPGSNAPKASDLRKQYGVHKAPLKVSSASTAYRRKMNFDEQFQSGPNKVETNSWIVIDPALVHPELGTNGTLVRANTYNGGLGARVDYLNKSNCTPIPAVNPDGTDTKERRRALKGYEACPLSEVPFIEVLPAPVVEDTKPEGTGITPTMEATAEVIPPVEESAPQQEPTTEGR